jgi:hypothetical protein
LTGISKSPAATKARRFDGCDPTNFSTASKFMQSGSSVGKFSANDIGGLRWKWGITEECFVDFGLTQPKREWTLQAPKRSARSIVQKTGEAGPVA